VRRLCFGVLADDDENVLVVCGVHYRTTPARFAVLARLAMEPGRTVPYQELADAVSDKLKTPRAEYDLSTDKSVHMHVSRLRKMLDRHQIKAVMRRGFRLELDLSLAEASPSVRTHDGHLVIDVGTGPVLFTPENAMQFGADVIESALELAPVMLPEGSKA